MQTIESKVQACFDAYANRLNQSLNEPPVVDVDGVVGAFTDCFVEASPTGILCNQNDAKFRAAVPQGFAFYKQIGTTSMTITDLNITPMDEMHVMVKVHWDSRYSLPEGRTERIEFDVFYMLQDRNDTLKIFAYVTGDEQKALREHGLIPQEEAPLHS